MRKVEKMNTNRKQKQERSIYQGDRSRKDNKPKRGRRQQQDY
tara:strand:+ start:715 stop:840 length:126 start_codon:yes stop_codon:yes gene_type:complete